MIDEDKMAEIKALPPGVVELIDCMMDAFDVMDKNQDTITIQSIADGFSLAISDGFDSAELYLSMFKHGLLLASAKGDEQ